MKSDIEIAQHAKMLSINEVASKLGIQADEVKITVNTKLK